MNKERPLKHMKISYALLEFDNRLAGITSMCCWEKTSEFYWPVTCQV